MSYPTPANSILNRDEADAARFSQVIYENESLKIQVETLQEKLESTGLLKLDDLRQENEGLRSEVATLRVQLDEKTSQLEHYRTSGDRFSNIDQSLHELLKQIQTQRAEMAEMKDVTRGKDARIAELTEQLKHAEEEMAEAHAQLSAAAADAAQQSEQGAETAAQREQISQLTQELETLRRAAEEEAGGLRRDLAAAQGELLQLKTDAAARSVVKGERMTAQERELAECREREASSQRQVVAMQAKMELLRSECSQLREAHNELLAKQRAAAAQPPPPRDTVAAAGSGRVDLYSPEVKAHVERAVRNATEGLERRLREQVDQNTSLLSRMALVQQESEAMLKSKGMSNHEVTVMKERVDMRSRRNDARYSMQRRVAELLSNAELSKEDIELLLQEMLDYQEDQDQENRTLLLVKDMEGEERERILRRELKRVKDENASLMKQLQQIAVEGFHRERSNSQSASAAPVATTPREMEARHAAPPPASASSEPGPSYGLPEPAYAGGAGLTPTRPAPPQQPQHNPQQRFGGDLWSNPPSRTAAAHPQPLYTQSAPSHVDPQPQPHTQLPNHMTAPGGSAAAPGADPNRSVMVNCPACTFTQKYGNRKCEICDAVLQLNTPA